MQETLVRFLGQEDPLEKGKATHSSILAWRIPWTVQSVGLQKVRHNWATFTFTHKITNFLKTDLIYIFDAWISDSWEQASTGRI